MRDRRKSLGVPSNLIWVLGDFDKIFRIDDFVWWKSFFAFFFSKCATTGDAATGAEVRPVRASGVAVMVARTTRDGDAAASCSETSSSVGEV